MKKVENIKSELVSVAEAASLLNIHQRTVRNNMPMVRIGRRTLVRIGDIEAKIQGGRSDAT